MLVFGLLLLLGRTEPHCIALNSWSQISPQNRTIQVDPATRPVYSMTRGSRYYGVNLLCELDMPNEYYIDRGTGMLYYWPPYDLRNAEIHVSRHPHVVVLGADGPGPYYAETPGPPVYSPNHLRKWCCEGATVAVLPK